MNKSKATAIFKKSARVIHSLAAKLLNEPFVKVTCTIIAGIIGGWLGATFQENSWREQNRLSMIESDRKQAEEIFNEVSRLMDDRYYKTVRLLSAYSQDDSAKIKEYRKSLVLQLEDWNANRHRMYSLLEGYYGVRFCNFFKTRIQHRFAITGNRIIYNGAATPDDRKEIKAYLDSIDSDISTFNRMMLDAIKQNKIGRFCGPTAKNG